MSQDRQLLTEFRRNRSEIAFEHLVERHLTLVYSTAMRMVNGDAHLAQDIAQTVFANFARKAGKLPEDVALAGWLHRDSRFTALEFLRKERRRAAREKEAATMHEIETSGDAVDWSRLRPILDEVLGELEEEDRHAVLLRFFEQRNLAEVGSTMGLSEDTARKRVSRALEKLRHLLSLRGVTTTATALALVLTSRGVEAVPPGLAGQFSRSALATAGATTLSTTGILTLFTSAKITTLVAAVAVLLFVGGAVVKFCASTSDVGNTGTAAMSDAAKTRDGATPNILSVSHATAAASPRDLGNDAAVADALAKLRAALYDPAPDADHPYLKVREAIAELGDRRTAAIPLLREAINDSSEEINNRAANGLGEIGSEATAAVPDLVQKLRSTDTGDNSLIRALQMISPTPEVGCDLARMLVDHPNSRSWIIDSLSESWMNSPDVAGVLNESVRPLLRDTDTEIKQMAAYALACVLRNRAGEDVVKVSIEGLESTNEEWRGKALAALENIGTDPTNLSGHITMDRLGAAAGGAVPALTKIVNTSNRKDQRMDALELLQAIKPGLLTANPAADNLLKTQEADRAFAMNLNIMRLKGQQMPLPELIEGLKEYPGAVGAIANTLGEMGPKAEAALPALKAALSGLAVQPGGSASDMFLATRSRETVANAIQKIAPDQPKVLFTYSDTSSVLHVFDDPAFKSDSAHRKALHAAMVLVWPVKGGVMEMSPDQMRLFLDSLQTNDQVAYDAVAAKVVSIDPHFFK